MAYRVLHLLFGFGGLGIAGLLAGCSPYEREERPPWRAEAERACFARGHVEDNGVIRSASPIEGPGICGLTHPFKVTALAGGTVTLNSTATLDCSMIEALDGWIKDVVQPAAMARFGEPVVRINSMGSYSCRGINNMSGAKLSEHSFGNAIDIGGFVLASGRELNIMRGFNGSDEQERAFLHEAHAGACPVFTTVLGPGYNVFHYNHFHVDLAMHGSTSRGLRRYCKPVPEQALPEAPKHDALPDPPPIEEEMDIARAPVPPPELGRRGPNFVATAPPPVLPGYRREEAVAASPRPVASSVARSDRLGSPRPAAPPVVTFAYSDASSPAAGEPPPDAEPAPVPRPRRRAAPLADAAAPPPPADPASPPDPAADASPPADADSAADVPTPPDPVPAPRRAAEPPPAVDASPADWDLTSKIRR